MTQVLTPPRRPRTAQAPAATPANLLRDLAYVLHLTQKVKAQVLSGAPAKPSAAGRDR